MISPILLISAGIAGFATAGGLGALCYGRARRRLRTMALFAIMSFALAVYSICNLLRDASPNPAAVIELTRGTDLCASLFIILLPFLYRDLSGQRAGWPEYVITGFYSLTLLVAVFRPTGLTWNSLTAMIPTDFGWLGRIYLPHGEYSHLLLPIHLFSLLVFCHCIRIALTGRRSDSGSLWLLMVLPVLLVIVLVHTIGRTQGWWRGPAVNEYAGLALYLGMGASIFARERDLLDERDERESKYRLLFENMTTGFALHEILCNEEGKPEDYRYLEINPAFERLTGVNASELVGKTILEVMPGTDAAPIDVFGSVALTGEPAAYENYSTELGKYFSVWVFSPKYGQFAVIFSDITERKRAAEALLQSERRLSLAISATADAIWEWNLNTEETYFSPRWYEMLGYEDRAFPMNFEAWTRLCHPDDLKPTTDQIQELLSIPQSSGFETECRMRTSNGSWVWILTRGNVVEWDAGGKAVLVSGTNTDITVRKQAEARWRRLMDSNMVGVLHWREDGAILDANDALLDMLGYTRDDLRAGALDWRKLTPPEHKAKDDRAIRELALHEICTPFEKEYLHKNGSRVPILLTGATLEGDQSQGVAFVLDMTELQAARQKLVESEERNRLLIQNAPEAIVVLDLERGTFVEHNTAAADSFGLSSEELLTVGPADVSPPRQPDGSASSEKAMHYVEQAVQGAAPHFEWVHRHKSGQEVPCEIWLTRLPATDRILVRGSITDITVRKTLEEQLRQSQKMQAIGQLAGGVAHDFNNLLHVIIGYSDLLLSDLMDPDHPLREPVAAIQAAAERAALLTQQLLLFSRKAIAEPIVLDLNNVLLHTGEMLRRLIGEDITLTTILASSLYRIKADPGQIEQVILNLSLNARDAMPRGGRLTIETHNTSFDNDDCRTHPDCLPGRFVQLTVTDTGCGMTSQVQTQIFEPFFTTKAPGKGTGLGLATVYGIVQQSGGFLRVTSEVGVGTTFHVFLPAVDAVAAAAPSEADSRRDLNGEETILLVEDEAMVRRIARHSLEQHGYRVLEASNGSEALRLVESQGDTIALLVTDVVMPEMSGGQLAEILCVRYPRLRVLFMSGYNEDAVVRHGIQEGTDAFLQKPYTPRALAQKVREVLDARNISHCPVFAPGFR